MSKSNRWHVVAIRNACCNFSMTNVFVLMYNDCLNILIVYSDFLLSYSQLFHKKANKKHCDKGELIITFGMNVK